MTTKMVNTDILHALMYDATRHKFNRQLDGEKLEPLLDPEGIHLLTGFMLHGEEQALPHVRCRVLLKLKGQRLPAEGWLDVELKQFARLPDLPAEAAS